MERKEEATPPTHTFGKDPKGVPPAGGRERKAGKGGGLKPTPGRGPIRCAAGGRLSTELA